MSDVQVPSAQPRRSWVESLFGVIARLQTWKNMAYLALAFPLGLFYFVFLVVGLALGVGLVIIWVGLPILAVVVLAWWAFAGFERLQAEHLLGVPTTGRLAPWEGDESWWQRVKRHLGDARHVEGPRLPLREVPAGGRVPRHRHAWWWRCRPR